MRPSPPPPSAVDPTGRPRFGMYAGALPEVDLDRARVAGWPGPLGALRLKQWAHWLVVTDDLALTVAVVDAVFTRLLWVQVIDRATGARFEHRREGPLVRARLARSLWDEHSRGTGRGLSIAIHDHLDAAEHRLEAEARTLGLPEVDLDLRAACPPEIEPLAVVLPVGRGRAMYSHKVPLPVTGTVRVGPRRFEVSEGSAVLDVHKAHYPRETFWRWATAVGRDARGRRIGLNLTENVVTDPELHENALWVDGRLSLLGPAAVSVGAEPWRARSRSGAIDLRFEGEGERSEDLDYGVVLSRFRQRFGRFTGTVEIEGEAVELLDGYGLMEDHQARW